MRPSYHPIAKFFHWTIVTVLAVQFLTGYLMPNFRHVTVPGFLTMTHISALSLLLIPLAFLFFFMRFASPVVKDVKEGEEWMDKAASALQYALYALLIIVPLSGWVAVSMRHLPVNFFNLFYLPVLNISNPSLLYTLGRMHSNLSAIIGILALGHIAAALFHHFVLRDSVLRRMLPGRSV